MAKIDETDREYERTVVDTSVTRSKTEVCPLSVTKSEQLNR